jgi:two-component system chemotaxis response regulator CheB
MTAERKIRVLVVDDSAFMRKAIQGMLAEDPEIEVVAVARDGREAVEKVLQLKPDVVTMDIEMPVMDGLTALGQIMDRCPVPVLMLSSLTEAGAQATFDALELGALDYIPKHLDDFSFNIFKIKENVVSKVKAVARKRVARKTAAARAVPIVDRRVGLIEHSKFATQKVALVAIGASTGGPSAVQDIIRVMPGGLPLAFVVVQHMPHNFTGPYAKRLDQLSSLDVVEAQDGMPVKNGTVLVAPGGTQMRIVKTGALDAAVKLSNDPIDAIYKPSVDITFQSIAVSYPGRALGVILTGMGADGKNGIKAMKESGSKVLAQDEESCVVYGMPKAVVDAGLQDKIVPLDKMPGEILNMV